MNKQHFLKPCSSITYGSFKPSVLIMQQKQPSFKNKVKIWHILFSGTLKKFIYFKNSFTCAHILFLYTDTLNINP